MGSPFAVDVVFEELTLPRQFSAVTVTLTTLL
jgi:hypothetical protein